MTENTLIEMTKLLVPALLSLMALCGTIVTAIIAFYSNRKMNSVEAKTDLQTKTIDAAAATATQTAHKADTIIEKAVEIHTLTNSNLSKVTASLELVQAEFRALKDSSAKEVFALREAISRMTEDKRFAQGVAKDLADDKISVAKELASKRRSDSRDDRMEVRIEGTLEAKEEIPKIAPPEKPADQDEKPIDVKIEGTLEKK